jgi:hypothetical protein
MFFVHFGRMLVMDKNPFSFFAGFSTRNAQTQGQQGHLRQLARGGYRREEFEEWSKCTFLVSTVSATWLL